MRLVLHPPGLIRLFTKNDAKETEATKKPETIDPDDYEVTPYGRRPVKRGHKRLKLTAKIVAAGSLAGLAIWLLV